MFNATFGTAGNWCTSASLDLWSGSAETRSVSLPGGWYVDWTQPNPGARMLSDDELTAVEVLMCGVNCTTGREGARRRESTMLWPRPTRPNGNGEPIEPVNHRSISRFLDRNGDGKVRDLQQEQKDANPCGGD